MINKKLLPLSLLAITCSSHTFAEQLPTPQWFNSIEYVYLNDGYFDFNAYQIVSHYYFEKQQSSGVLDDYGYLDTDSNIKLDYTNSNYNNQLGISGEGFYNKWFATGKLYDTGNTDNYTVGIGYLFANALKVSLLKEEREFGDDYFRIRAQYNHQINDKDYLGLSIETYDELDAWSATARYFNHLSDDRYLVFDFGHQDNDSYNSSSAMVSYYFNRKYALGMGIDDSDLSLQAKYFINNQYYLIANFTREDPGELYSLKFVAQF